MGGPVRLVSRPRGAALGLPASRPILTETDAVKRALIRLAPIRMEVGSRLRTPPPPLTGEAAPLRETLTVIGEDILAGGLPPVLLGTGPLVNADKGRGHGRDEVTRAAAALPDRPPRASSPLYVTRGRGHLRSHDRRETASRGGDAESVVLRERIRPLRRVPRQPGATLREGVVEVAGTLPLETGLSFAVGPPVTVADAADVMRLRPVAGAHDASRIPPTRLPLVVPTVGVA